MSLFDNIKCNFNLPKPEPILELENYPLNNCIFKTQNFKNLMDDYLIDPNGILYKIEYSIDDATPIPPIYNNQNLNLITEIVQLVNKQYSKNINTYKPINLNAEDILKTLKKKNPKLNPINFTGEIEIFNLIDSPITDINVNPNNLTQLKNNLQFKFDYKINYSLNFIKGILQDSVIINYTYHDNTQRLTQFKSEFNSLIAKYLKN